MEIPKCRQNGSSNIFNRHISLTAFSIHNSISRSNIKKRCHRFHQLIVDMHNEEIFDQKRVLFSVAKIYSTKTNGLCISKAIDSIRLAGTNKSSREIHSNCDYTAASLLTTINNTSRMYLCSKRFRFVRIQLTWGFG